MALGSQSLVPFVIVVGLLFAPGCACLPARDEMRVHEGNIWGEGSVAQQQPSADFGCRSLAEGCWSTPVQFPNSPTTASPSQPEQPCLDGCPQDSGRPPPPPVAVRDASPHLPETSITPTPPSQSDSLPPPPPSRENPGYPGSPQGNASPNNNGNATPTEVGRQGKKSNSNVASAVGWAFLAAALALQGVLFSYLVYKRRELELLGTRLEKAPSVSPPPSPAGFASYSAAR